MTPLEAQIALAKDLQMALLEDFRNMLRDGTMTAADRAVLRKILADNGWSLDESNLKKSLKDTVDAALDTLPDPKTGDLEAEYGPLRVVNG